MRSPRISISCRSAISSRPTPRRSRCTSRWSTGCCTPSRPPTPSALPASFPPTVEVYPELSLNRIIVEIQAHDQIGLLYRLVKTISDHGFDTTFARINTERSVAIDTFYIEPNKPEAGAVDPAK